MHSGSGNRFLGMCVYGLGCRVLARLYSVVLVTFLMQFYHSTTLLLTLYSDLPITDLYVRVCARWWEWFFSVHVLCVCVNCT